MFLEFGVDIAVWVSKQKKSVHILISNKIPRPIPYLWALDFILQSMDVAVSTFNLNGFCKNKLFVLQWSKTDCMDKNITSLALDLAL